MEEFDAQKQIIQKAIADITAGRDINIGDVTQIVNVPQPERFIPEDMPANLPTSNTVKFVGREKKLIELHELLKSRQAVMVTALAGMGGVGKTELATQYAWLYYLTEGYPGGICWVRARNEDLGLQITGFTREKFGLKIPDDITDPVARVKHCWDRWLAGNVLIIFVATEYVDLLADENEEIVWLFTGLARFYENQTLYLDTEKWYKKCLEVTKEKFGESHPDVAQSMNNLALLYDNQGKYAAAEPLYIDALQMKKELLGDRHPSVALSMNNLALLYRSQGKYAAAEPLYKEALSLFESLLGADHPSTATVRENYKIFLQQKASAATPPKEGLLSKVWNILKTEL